MNSEPLSVADLQLWSSAAAGESAAGQQLVERMWQLCAFRLRHFRADEREEIEQSMAASLLRALASGVVPASNLDGLLEWRGRAEITAFVRARIRDRRFEHLGPALECAGHDPAPFDTVAIDELRNHLQGCIERIPNRDQRQAVQLRLVGGMSPHEVAQRRGAKVSAVRVWIARGAALVRACLEQKLRHARGA